MNPLPALLTPTSLPSGPETGAFPAISALTDALFADILAQLEPGGSGTQPARASAALPLDGKVLPKGQTEVEILAVPIADPAVAATPEPDADAPAAPLDGALSVLLPGPALVAQAAPSRFPTGGKEATTGAAQGLPVPAPHPLAQQSALPQPAVLFESSPPAIEERTGPATDTAQGLADRVSLAVELRSSPMSGPAIVPDAADLNASTTPALAQHSPSPHRVAGFEAIVERIVAAREASGDAPVTIAVRNEDFGAIAMRFAPGEHGIAVTATSADPEFARAVAAATPTERGAWQAGGDARDPQQPASQQAAQQGDQRAAPALLRTRRERDPGDAPADDASPEPRFKRRADGLFA